MKRQCVLRQVLRLSNHHGNKAQGLVLLSSLLSLTALPCLAQSTLPWDQHDQPSTSPNWKLTNPGSTPDSTKISQSNQPLGSQPGQPDPTTTAPQSTPPGKPFLDVGIGPRIGIGEPTYPAASLRFGVPLSTTTSLSLRPFYVFGNSDSNGAPNSQGEFTIPLTLDLFTNSPVSVYFGPGATWNVDSSGLTVFSLSGGLDFKIIEKIRLSTGLYYGMDNDRSGFGDWGANAFLYFRF